MNQPDQGQRLVRAACTAETITVYQAYSPQIAEAAIRAGTFVPPFSPDRMTWIKPSFGWMMHRSGWATKPGQERVLAIEITRAGFDWALAHSCLSHHDPAQHDSPQDWAALKEASPVRVQWDPDRSVDVLGWQPGDGFGGNLLGTALGAAAIDHDLVEGLEGSAIISQVADDLHDVFGLGQPPPVQRYPAGQEEDSL